MSVPPCLAFFNLPPCEPSLNSLSFLFCHIIVRGVATGVYIPPKSVQVNFLWGKNDVRMAIEQFYTPKKLLYPPKQISGYAPDYCLYWATYLSVLCFYI